MAGCRPVSRCVQAEDDDLESNRSEEEAADAESLRPSAVISYPHMFLHHKTFFCEVREGREGAWRRHDLCHQRSSR